MTTFWFSFLLVLQRKPVICVACGKSRRRKKKKKIACGASLEQMLDFVMEKYRCLWSSAGPLCHMFNVCYAHRRGKHIVVTLSVRPSVCPSVRLSRYLVRQITLKLQLPFKSNWVYRQMAMRVRTEPKNHNHTLYIYTVLSPLNHFS